jgi:alpha-mannosidase
LDRIWKTVLLHQFHDILPGSSIAWVHREAERTYAAVAEELEGIIGRAQRALAGDPAAGGEVAFNAAPHERAGVPAGGGRRAASGPDDSPGGCTVEARPGGGFVLDNGLLRVVVDERGLVVSVLDLAEGRETVAPGGAANLLQIHPDFPNMWDAWDVDQFYRNTVTDLTDVDEVSVATERGRAVSVRVTRSFGSSRAVQTLTLAAGAKRLDLDTEVDWHETEKFLKAAFPLDLHSDRYAAETQFGHLYRPTHTNTSWEAAKFEACNHRFVHFEEPGWGVALVTASTYGHDVTRTVRPDDGGTTTTVRVSLLRAPRFPDPHTDQGTHRFRHALVPGAAVGDAVREGYRVNLPERRVPGDADVVPLVAVDDDAVVVSAVKLADDRSGDVVVRVYESRGGRVRARLTTDLGLDGVEVCDLLERPLEDVPAGAVTVTDGALELALRPFQLLTLRFAGIGSAR